MRKTAYLLPSVPRPCCESIVSEARFHTIPRNIFHTQHAVTTAGSDTSNSRRHRAYITSLERTAVGTGVKKRACSPQAPERRCLARCAYYYRGGTNRSTSAGKLAPVHNNTVLGEGMGRKVGVHKSPTGREGGTLIACKGYPLIVLQGVPSKVQHFCFVDVVTHPLPLSALQLRVRYLSAFQTVEKNTDLESVEQKVCRGVVCSRLSVCVMSASPVTHSLVAASTHRLDLSRPFASLQAGFAILQTGPAITHR